MDSLENLPSLQIVQLEVNFLDWLHLLFALWFHLLVCTWNKCLSEDRKYRFIEKSDPSNIQIDRKCRFIENSDGSKITIRRKFKCIEKSDRNTYISRNDFKNSVLFDFHTSSKSRDWDSISWIIFSSLSLIPSLISTAFNRDAWSGPTFSSCRL